MSDRIEGFVVGGTTRITVADCGLGVALSVERRGLETIETVLSREQSARLRRLLSASEKRASYLEPRP